MIALATAMLVIAGQGNAAAPRCSWEHGGVQHYGPARDCRSWLKPRRFVGVWINEFEGSRFVEGAKTLAEARRVRFGGPKDIWLSRDDRSQLPQGCRALLGEAFLIDFIGREGAWRPDRPPNVIGGGFGHLGAWSREVLINRATTVRPLGSLPGAQVRGTSRQQPCG